MNSDLYPKIRAGVDTEQIIAREIPLILADGDDRYDMSAPYRSGTFRPEYITLRYRVNRGAATPFWYLFQVSIRAAKVLKDGTTSAAHQNSISERYYPEFAPEWARLMGADLLPVVEVERRAHRGASGV